MTMWPFHRKSPVYSSASNKEPNLPSNQALAGTDNSQTPNYNYPGQLDPAAAGAAGAGAGAAGGYAANGYGYGANGAAGGYPPTGGYQPPGGGYQPSSQDPYAGSTQPTNYNNPYATGNDPYNAAGAATAGNYANNPYAQSQAGGAGGNGQNEANQIVNSYANQQYQPYPGTQAAPGAQPAGYEPRTADARAANPAYGGANGYSTAYPSENQLPPSTNPGDDPQSNARYQAGNTGYDAGNTGYNPPGMSRYQSPAGQYSSPGGPADSAAGGYRPGSTAGKNYPGGSSGTAGGTGGY